MNVNNSNNRYNEIIEKFNRKKEEDIKNNKPPINRIVELGKELTANKVEFNVPENGKFNTVYMQFEVPKTNNLAVFEINCDEQNPKTQRYLSIGVRHKQGDRLVSNLLMHGTKDEILEYLKSGENTQELVQIVQELSKETDDFYSSL